MPVLVLIIPVNLGKSCPTFELLIEAPLCGLCLDCLVAVCFCFACCFYARSNLPLCELQSHLSLCLTGVALLIRLILFGWCLWHFLHQIGQKSALHCPGQRTKCNGCSPIKVKENFTPPSSFQRFQICPDIVFSQLTFVKCIVRYAVDYRFITSYSIPLDN